MTLKKKEKGNLLFSVFIFSCTFTHVCFQSGNPTVTTCTAITDQTSASALSQAHLRLYPRLITDDQSFRYSFNSFQNRGEAVKRDWHLHVERKWQSSESEIVLHSTVLRHEREEILQKSLENLILKGGDVRYFLDHWCSLCTDHFEFLCFKH